MDIFQKLGLKAASVRCPEGAGNRVGEFPCGADLTDEHDRWTLMLLIVAFNTLSV